METKIPFLEHSQTLDRRKRKTRQAIELALLELLGTKKIDEILGTDNNVNDESFDTDDNE